VPKSLTVSILSNASTQSWTADDDYVLEQCINYGGGNVVVHLDPDMTYASWLAALQDGVSDQMFIFIAGDPAVRGSFIVSGLKFPINKSQKIFISAESTTILGVLLTTAKDRVVSVEPVL
jgi:hypothetical protein